MYISCSQLVESLALLPQKKKTILKKEWKNDIGKIILTICLAQSHKFNKRV